MTKQMLIDATHDEETRVAIVEGYKLLEFDYESKFRKPLKGSIFLAKVTRVEPSLQAAFVNFGGNRHGFLPFSEIHPDYFRIPIADREALLAEQQAIIEEMEKEEELRRAQYREQAEAEEAQGLLPDGSLESGHAERVETIEEITDEDRPIEEVGGSDHGFAVDDQVSSDAGESPRTARVYDRQLDNAFTQSMEQRPEEEFSTSGTDDLGDGHSDGHSDGHLDGMGDDMNDDMSDEAHVDGADDAQDDVQDGQEQTDQAEGADVSEGGEGRGRGRGRHGRGRHGRGRHGSGRGRHRMAHSSRRVESFGGEEYDDAGGGDRLRFNLRRKYKIQEVIKRGQIMLVQVSKEERGNKGAAVSTYLSLPGRYCVLMPNSPRAGGVSRKIASYKDRARMREIVQDLEVPKGMSVIVRTAGVARSKEEIKRDLDYLMRLWDNIRELTLQSSAPSIVYEEADLIKRAVRDLYGKDIEDVIVAGEEGFDTARNFMKMLMPTHTDRVKHYTEEHMPLFNKFKVEQQIAEIGESQVTLPSGGYLVINQTEALVAIDVNSGRATKERHIEETALKTNMEAAHEVARQLRLRDLGGLVVVDFIDMEDRRNNAKVERKMRDALSTDRARIQMGRISSFGLRELSRQRLNPSLNESQFELCQHCAGLGRVRTCDATAIMVLRALEEEGVKRNAAQLIAHVSNDVAVYILNNKRKILSQIESRYGLGVSIRVDDQIAASKFRIETLKTSQPTDDDRVRSEVPAVITGSGVEEFEASESPREERGPGDDGSRRRGRRGGRNRGRRDNRDNRGGDRGGDRGEPRRPDQRGPRHFDDAVPPSFGDQPFEANDPHFNKAVGAPVESGDFNEDPDDNRGNREHLNRSREMERDFGRRGGGNRQDNRGGRDGGGRGRSGGRHRGGRDGGRGDRPDRGPRGSGNNAGGPNMNGPRAGGFSSGAVSDVSVQPYYEPASDLDVRAVKPNVPAFQPETPAQQKIAPSVSPSVAPSSPVAEDRSAEHARTFEKVNEPPKEKKRGWWSRG